MLNASQTPWLKSEGRSGTLILRKVKSYDLASRLEANVRDTEAIKFADKELSKLCSSWTSPAWDEMDWDRMKELQVRDILEKRQAQAAIAQSCRCLECPNFLKHVCALSSCLSESPYADID